MKRERLTRDVLQGLLAAAILAAALPVPSLVFAQGANDLSGSVNTVHEGLLNIPNIVAGIFYIVGAALIGSGAMLLKKHAENPSQTGLGHGLGRIVAGAVLIALPAFGVWLNNSLNIGQNAATSQSLGTIQ